MRHPSMYEREVGVEDRHKQSRESITRLWALLLGISVAPIYILFDYFGDPGRGQAAAVSAAMIALAARLLWDLRKRIWFWTTLGVVVLFHVALIVPISWPYKRLTYIAALPFGLADLGVVYGIIRLVERAVEKSSGKKNQ